MSSLHTSLWPSATRQIAPAPRPVHRPILGVPPESVRRREPVAIQLWCLAPTILLRALFEFAKSHRHLLCPFTVLNYQVSLISVFPSSSSPPNLSTISPS